MTMLAAHQCFPTGGFGPDEQLLPRDAWHKKTDYTHNSFETQCGAFAVFKLCKYLMTITGDARYGDWVERLVYNGIAATIPMSPDGLVFYYSDYNALGGAKRNHSGRLVVLHRHPADGAGRPARPRLLPRRRRPLRQPVRALDCGLESAAMARSRFASGLGFPRPNRPSCLSHRARPAMFGLKLRVPGWLAGPMGVAVNGRACRGTGRRARLGHRAPAVAQRRPG